ncbi:MMPL family transporter [Paenibacillus sp. UMB4589-SE434]|uniref:MMPL family transporter n=1 Tax=Paenibacillus sp. UMB4589-SE434 TaxID=3046314 RepID=UPI00254FD88D|nr:MMPL family transporter [Paenibacillus sp. UMB4589-SE434]MDK8182281.1 MMPL family transporter [Paenibacillus sp. UMB4589-SE434]
MRETDKQGVFWRWGTLIYRHRKLVISLWLVLFAAMAIFAVQVPSLLKDNGFTPNGSESDQGLKLLREQMHISSNALDIVYKSKDSSSLLSERAKARIMDSLSELRQQSYVTDILFAEYTRVSERNDIIAVSVLLDLDTNDALELYPSIRNLIPSMVDMDTYVSGATPVYYDMQVASKNDIVKSELIGLPIALLVLLLVFGTWLAGVLPLVVGLLSVTTTLGLIYFISFVSSPLSNFLPNLVSMLGLAVGIDYALFMVSRFREELRNQGTLEGAVAMTAQKAGQSIFFSGVAVLIGLVAMAFIDLSLFRSLALGGVIVVTISVVVGNTLLLALFGMIGERINRYPVIPLRWRHRKRKLADNCQGEGKLKEGFWGKVAYGVMSRPITIVVLLTLGLIVCAWPVGSMKIGIPNAEVLPPTYESRHGADLMELVYDKREINSLHVLLRLEQAYTEARSIEQAEQLEREIASLPSVLRVQSYVSLVSNLPSTEAKLAAIRQPAIQSQLEHRHLANGHYVMLHVVPRVNTDGDQAFNLVRDLRGLELQGTDIYVTGGPAYRLDIVERITTALPFVVIFILTVTYVVLFLAFRSVLLPLKAVLMNVLSLGASLGIVVLVFQYGYMADLFKVTSTGIVVAMLPVIIFCVVFGISMDYEVFLLSRIAEEYEASGDNERSTAEGLKKTGGIITSAAFILIAVVGAFIFTDNEMMKAIGLGLATSVLLDATLIRIFLVPALMKLMGRANWWSPWHKRPNSSRDAA